MGEGTYSWRGRKVYGRLYGTVCVCGVPKLSKGVAMRDWSHAMLNEGCAMRRYEYAMGGILREGFEIKPFV